MKKADIIIDSRLDGSHSVIVLNLPEDLAKAVEDEIRATITLYRNFWNKDEKEMI